MRAMITPRLLVSLFLFFWSASALAQQSNLLQAEEAFRFSVERNQADAITLHWDIEEGYYLYRGHLKAKDDRTGESVMLQTDPGVIQSDDPNFGPSEVYYSRAVAQLGAQLPDHVGITYQGCKKDSICYPPIRLTLDTKTLGFSEAMVGFGAATPQTTALSGSEAVGFQLSNDFTSGGMVGSLLASGGAFWVIASFLMFGLLLAFTPCVLPMYPILSATLARDGEALTARRGFVLSLAYVLAMAAAFGVLGVVAAWSGQNIQILFQSPYAVGMLSLLFVVLASSMFGLFELQLPTAWINRVAGVQAGKRGSIGGAAALGFISALIIGPCVTAPLAAALLYIAQTGDGLLGASALFALGVGQGLPLIAFGTMGSRALPRVGAWMVQVKYIFGFVFLSTAIWMASRLLPPPATLALWAVLLLTAAVFIGVADRLTASATAGPRFRKAAGLALSLAGVILALGAASGGSDPLRPLAQLGIGSGGQDPATELDFTEVRSTSALQEKLTAANSQPTLVYFTADWCVACKIIERNVLPNLEIVAGLNGFQRIKVDLTTPNETNQALMRDIAVVGPPTMVFFDKEAVELSDTRLVGDVTTETMRAAIRRAGQ